MLHNAKDVLAWPKDKYGWHKGPLTGGIIYIGDDVMLGDDVKLGNRVTSESLNMRYRQAFIDAASEHIFIKWVNKKRFSPGWGSANSIEYIKGATVTADDAKISDRQCAPGLHVFRIGVEPRDVGLGELSDELIALRVLVKSEDICFAGLPGNADKIRVKRLKVID